MLTPLRQTEGSGRKTTTRHPNGTGPAARVAHRHFRESIRACYTAHMAPNRAQRRANGFRSARTGKLIFDAGQNFSLVKAKPDA